MKHLVLGSKGQVGSYVVDELALRGEQFVKWDIRINPHHDLSNGANKEALKRIVEEVDFVHFLAYNVGGSTYLAKYGTSYDYVSHNMNLMENTFDVLRETGKPFYFASSQMSNMYGSVYGRLKAAGEAYTNALPNGLNIQFWNVYGYETEPEKTHVITDFIRMALKEERILVRTNGEEQRNFLYGTDAATMLVNLADAMTTSDSIKSNTLRVIVKQRDGIIPICASSYETKSIYEIAKIISDYVGGRSNDIPIYFTKKVDTTQEKFNFPPNYYPFEKSFLGIEDFVSTQDGIRKLVAKERNDLK